MSGLADRLGVSTTVLILIGIVGIVQIGLALAALFDLWRRDRVATGHKWLWVVLILVGNFAGSLLYLTVGRDVPPEVVEQPASHADTSLSHSERIRRGVDLLYGSAE
jgi:hypothetical protein